MAGPLCVAAVAWPADVVLPGLTDSKLISAKRRRELAMMIRHHATAIGIGWAAACEIDRIGLSHALRQAAEQALSQINVEYTTIVVDGTVPLVQDKRVTCVIKADLIVPAVSAASIIAKVARDTYMQTRHSEFTHYEPRPAAYPKQMDTPVQATFREVHS